MPRFMIRPAVGAGDVSRRYAVADARIEITTRDDLFAVTTWCGSRRLMPFPVVGPDIEHAFARALQFHARHRCRPGGCPIHTQEVAHVNDEPH